ncbi:MAG: hypothetical protein RMM17_04640 [Acidobacteriota bacterium]|nr:hypothetical protein [Blastocatellia bacterium]MDW8411951.1 hypothetical protein [Acidobacteriota bacterium]
MMQVKSLIKLMHVAQILRFDQASPDSIVDSYQCTVSLARVISSCLEKASKGQHMVLTGERGVGKSHMLAFIRSILASPSLLEKLDDEAKRIINPRLPSERPLVFPIYFNAELEVERIANESLGAIRSLMSRGKLVTVFVDGISRYLVSGNSNVLRWWQQLLELAAEGGIKVYVEMYEEASHLATGSTEFAFESLGLWALAEVFEQRIAVKDAMQRSELRKLYSRIKAELPTFSATSDEFVRLYPVHPQLLELIPNLRKYSGKFSFFGFFYSVISRAMLKRDFNLITVVHLFEAFEFEFRKIDDLVYLLSVYDKLSVTFVRALPQSQQIYGKLLLTGLTVLSISGKARTLAEILDAVMLFDEGEGFKQRMASYMELMAITAGDSIEVIRDGELAYRLRLSQEVRDPVAEAAAQISDEDERLTLALLEGGSHCFKDWPAELGSCGYAEVEIIWRGTARRGAILLGEREVGFDWVLQIVPINSFKGQGEDEPLKALAERTNCKMYWYPAELLPEEVEILKRYVAVDQIVDMAAKLDSERAYLLAQIVRIFLRVYVEAGRYGELLFRVRSRNFDIETRLFPNSRRLAGVLASIFSNELETLFHRHPKFRSALGERALRELIRLFFYHPEWSMERNIELLRDFAEPLQLVKRDVAGWRFVTWQEVEADTALGYLLTKVRLSPQRWVSRVELERVLRKPPYGIQPPVALLMAIGAAAAGLVVLADEQGEVILSSAGLRQGADVNSYSRIYDAELLQEPVVNAEEVYFKGQLDELLEDALQEAFGEPIQEFDDEPCFTSEDVLVEFYQTGFFTQTGSRRSEVNQEVAAPVEEVVSQEVSQVIAQRRVVNERVSRKEVEYLCREFFEACRIYEQQQTISEESLEAMIFDAARRLMIEKRLKEVVCVVELEGGKVHISLQGSRASLFDGQRQKYRLI